MCKRDEIAATNRRHWDRMVKEGCGFTIPWLNLDVSALRQYATGQLDLAPEPLRDIYPPRVLSDVGGKDVLCLASGGGQQSAVFGLLGARVTVLDLTQGQLDADTRAARHYGYGITTICGDMRDLSGIGSESFDLVYQAPSMGYVPDVRDVYSEVARALRSDGVYRVEHGNPATVVVDENSWDGQGYRIAVPYGGGRIEDNEYTAIEFRHLLADSFNELLAVGCCILAVHEAPCHLHHSAATRPGTWTHMLTYVQMQFAVVASKNHRPAQQSGRVKENAFDP